MSGMRRKIMLLGSSITQRSFSLEHSGWGAALQNWYSRTADVLNRGAGGYNSRWLWKYLPQMIGGEKPDMSILFIGNNDSIQEGESQHVPIDEYKRNVVSILQYLYGIKRNMIVLVVSTSQSNQTLRPLHSNHIRTEYAEALHRIVQNYDEIHNLPKYMQYVDLISASSSNRIGTEDLHDGAHLNSTGNHKVYKAIKACINTHYPSFSPDFVQHKGRGQPKPNPLTLLVPLSPTTIIHTSISSSSLTTSASFPELASAPSSLPSSPISSRSSSPSPSPIPFESASFPPHMHDCSEYLEGDDDTGIPTLSLTVPIWHHLV
ncbi:hypothetical protein EON63_02195 [archaeon]|nr:MAG: hypothetical protein EON63_02195 [archaeon]